MEQVNMKNNYIVPTAELTIFAPLEDINVTDEEELAEALSGERAGGGFTFEVIDPDFGGFD